MTVAEVMSELEKLGNEQTKKTLMRHGAVEPIFGVKIGDTKPLQKKTKHALSIADQWIKAKKDLVAAAGWNTYIHYLSVTDNEELDSAKFAELLTKVVSEIHDQSNEVKTAMNGFVIALGSYLPELTKKAKAAAKKIGKVEVDQGNTACKTPDALADISKIEKMGRIGEKRKNARC